MGYASYDQVCLNRSIIMTLINWELSIEVLQPLKLLSYSDSIFVICVRSNFTVTLMSLRTPRSFFTLPFGMRD